MDFSPPWVQETGQAARSFYVRVRGAIVAACLAFWALDAGVVRLPLPDEAWQQEQAAQISCNVAVMGSLGLPEDEVLPLLERHCR